MTIPPFLLKVFLECSSSAPEELGFLAVATGKAFLAENEDAPNKDNLKDKLGDILCFLWEISKNVVFHFFCLEIVKFQNVSYNCLNILNFSVFS